MSSREDLEKKIANISSIPDGKQREKAYNALKKEIKDAVTGAVQNHYLSSLELVYEPPKGGIINWLRNL